MLERADAKHHDYGEKHAPVYEVCFHESETGHKRRVVITSQRICLREFARHDYLDYGSSPGQIWWYFEL